MAGGGGAETALPGSKAMAGDSTAVLCKEAVLRGDTLVCSPSSSPAQAFSALGRGVTKTKPMQTKR